MKKNNMMQTHPIQCPKCKQMADWLVYVKRRRFWRILPLRYRYISWCKLCLIKYSPLLVDIKEMPNFNATAVQNGTDSVSKKKVYWTVKNKVTCKEHGAMLCVSEDRRIWRCPTCHEGGYIKGVF